MNSPTARSCVGSTFGDAFAALGPGTGEMCRLVPADGPASASRSSEFTEAALARFLAFFVGCLVNILNTFKG